MTDTFRTRITDILDAHGIVDRLLRYRVAVFTVERAAAQRARWVLEEMVKSILLRDASGRFVMVCVPGALRGAPQGRASL